MTETQKCHGCLDNVPRLWREELGEWWHFPANLGAYSCPIQKPTSSDAPDGQKAPCVSPQVGK